MNKSDTFGPFKTFYEGKNYQISNVKKPELYRELFPYSEVCKVTFDNRILPISPPERLFISDTTFRDGQQARPPYTTRQIIDLFKLLHQLGGPEGVIRHSEFFLYSDKDKKAVEDLGFDALPIDATPRQDQINTSFHWDFIDDIFQEIKNLDFKKIAGALQISTFNCGCDSFMAEFIEEEFKQQKIPYTRLIIDEHSGEAGIVTRVEAFLDTLTNKKISVA